MATLMHDANYAPSGSEILVAVDAALECLEWSEIDGDSGEPLDSLGLYFTPAARETVAADVESFILSNSADLHGLDYSQIGHDFILTRNGHGAGFWDRGLGERGERLSDAARAYGTIEAYAQDGDLHVQ